MWHCGLIGALPFLSSLACTSAAIDHRVVVYYQTTHYNSSTSSDVSLLPLVEDQQHIAATHVLISAVHIVDEDGGIKLNDNVPGDKIFDHVWSDAAHLQANGVTVMAMVGGAAVGSWDRLDGSDAQFEHYYSPLHEFIGNYNIQGLDLDVEQAMSLSGIIRLIDRLKKDFGDEFVISLAPVGSALKKGGGNLSGFDYFELEAKRGDKISFYNAQFYFGWGDPSSTADYEDIIDDGFPAEKVVMGLLTSPDNGNGYVGLDKQAPVLESLVAENPSFGGVAGWEYFNSLPGGKSAPYKWASWMAEHITPTKLDASGHPQARQISSTEVARRSLRKSYRRVKAFGRSIYRDYMA